ncbi:hypothetical protein BISA_0833 [Bifidobacterium saguini DSM 23967]|uniref:Uncharacterized protein n=2 Tax=Bifidobacterium saguini TaxID=762210 RepID=A0A087DA83_9BIFI|nr:hypothetical protein [Bifidobacterium saguini]KFI92433.1 hypothetical protein BISA_0833 [Bifidobacterium saguini DSM 23967]QTB90840.1 hypothetical protein BSD967_11255 [Bifidobacterium saguini]
MKPKANISLGKAWRLTREILKDHRSHSYAALAGWSYIPSDGEIALWDRMELEGRLKRRGWRPWADRHNDPFAPVHVETRETRERRLERRSRLKQRYHITD